MGFLGWLGIGKDDEESFDPTTSKSWENLLLEQGLKRPLARDAAEILQQDNNFGLDARTPQQIEKMHEVRDEFLNFDSAWDDDE
ncbi:MAG: hypothetical protein SAL07_19670 [Oscillatoria sp. PMC 1051.18]|nr:hypothetical protein [Oscillatoria sp. PMC 1050.18]MEC5032122.1 hypothetical protein [Oscillatoria sp. PMC 1051.18]